MTLFYFRFVYKTKLGTPCGSPQSSLHIITQWFSTDTPSDKKKDESAETVFKPGDIQEYSTYICVLLLGIHS